MAVQNRDVALFDSRMKKTNKISEGLYRATTAKRQKEIIPEGIKVYDTDLEQMFTGNGNTAGGVADGGNSNMRKITVAAAAASGTVLVTPAVSGSAVQFTDPKFAQLRTGDGITFATAAGTVPSGVGTSEVWLIKATDEASASGLLASTRANALAGTAKTVFNSGALGYTTVITTVAADKGERMMYVAAAAATTIVVPNEEQAEDFSILIRKSVQDAVVTVSGLSTTGAVAGLDMEASGNSSIVLRALDGDYVDLTLDSDGNQYIITSLSNS